MQATEGVELKEGDVGYLNSDGEAGILYSSGSPEAEAWLGENSKPHELEGEAPPPSGTKED